jgi:hypothetical protein
MKKPGAPFVLPGVVRRENTAMVRRALAVVMVFAMLFSAAGAAYAQAPAQNEQNDAQSDDATPARLSYTTGSVSFWRPGGADWAPAQMNTPLAAGDELFTGHDGNLEMQVGGSAFVRAWGDTQLGVANQDPNFLQIRVTAGHVALDFRALDPGEVVELATPGAAFTVDQPGYYRVDVTPDRTSFVTRRGRATMTPAGGTPAPIAAGESVVLEGPTPNVQRAAAPEGDVWDRWNDARTAALLTTVSAKYVPPQVYGTSELDRYGTWQSDVTYGSVWVPTAVAPGWVPYSTGRWIWDPRFGWTWVDTAPWGWAPYHYGRWVYLGHRWAWAPGPVIVRPVYAPALVAFYGAPGGSVTVAGPSVGWVALGWGEPCVPWWGRPGFVGRPWWGGWGGPRVQHVHVHRNVTVVNAVVVVRSDHFGRRGVQEARIARPDLKKLEPVRGPLAVKPEPASFTPRTGQAARPPEAPVSRAVVTTRPPVQRPDPPRGNGGRDGSATAKPEGQPGARRDGKVDSKGDGKPSPRPGARGEAKPDTAGDGKAGVAPGGRGEPKIEGKPDGRREGARDARPDGSPERRGDAKTNARPPVVDTPAAKVAPPASVAPPMTAPRPPDAPRAVEPPRSEIRRPEPPRVAPVPPRPETQRPDPRSEPQRPDGQRLEPPRGEPRRMEQPRSEAPRIEPRRHEAITAEPRRQEIPHAATPRVETPRAEAPRVEAPRVETPRRAAAPAADAVHRPAPARVVTPAPARVVAPSPPSQAAPAQARGRPAPGERGRQER